MTDGSTYTGNSVGPVGSLSVREMKVTEGRKEQQSHHKKKEQRSHTGKNADEIVEELNQAMHAISRHIAFALGNDDKGRVLQIVDTDSNTVIRSLPLDDLHFTERIQDLLGVLVDKHG